MTKEITYKVRPPISNFMMKKDIMTEAELREFIPTIVQDPDQLKTWEEKAKDDPIEELVELLTRAGYTVEKQ